jgi:hypothetical protein
MAQEVLSSKRVGDVLEPDEAKKTREAAAPTSSLAVVVDRMLTQLGPDKVEKLRRSIGSFGDQITVCSLCSGSEIQGFSLNDLLPIGFLI